MQFRQQSWFIAALLVTTATACVGGGQSSGNERFVALELKEDDGRLIEGNVTFFTIEGDEIIPTFRLGPSADIDPIEIRSDFGSGDEDSYYGFPEFVNGRAAFVSRGSDADQLSLIDVATGEKSRLLSSEARFSDIKFFEKRAVIVANSGYGEE